MKNTERSACLPNGAPFASPLPDWGLIHATGADAQGFLHGQFTNDLLALRPDGAQWNGYCSAKGRLYAAFLVWRDSGDGFYLAAERALLPGLVKRLRMFVLRAKVVLEDVSEAFRIQGLVGPDLPAPMAVARKAPLTLVGLPPVHGVARGLAVSGKEAAFDSGLAPGSADDWQRLMIHAGEVWITPATQEQFVPQMVNLDAIGAINFKKGCYPGQEIVARAHYRGAVKRRAYLAHVEGAAKAGDPLFAADPGRSDGGQESGLVANAAPAPGGGSDVLAVVQIQSHAQAQIHLGAADGSLLHFAELPYAIPAAA